MASTIALPAPVTVPRWPSARALLSKSTSPRAWASHARSVDDVDGHGGGSRESRHEGGFGPGAARRRLGEPGPRRYAVLLVTVIASFAILGVSEPTAWGQLAVTCLLAATLMLALRVSQARPSVVAVATAIVAVTVAIGVVEAVNGSVDGRAIQIANGLVAALAPPAIMVGVVRTLRAERRVGIEAVFGVISIYVLLGMFYAFIYGSIDRLGGAPFFAQGGAAPTSRCLYFSFTTLSTVGYGDLTARTNLGHTLSVSEALVGQIYLVTIVSLLVANLGRRARPAQEGTETP